MQAMKYASERIHPGFETQGKCHQKSKMGITDPTERTYVLQKIKNTKVCLELWCMGNPVLKPWFPCQIYSVDDISL